MDKGLQVYDFNKAVKSGQPAQGAGADAVIEELFHLRRSTVRDENFWQRFCACISALCRARGVMAVSLESSGEWAMLGRHLAQDELLSMVWKKTLPELYDRAFQKGFATTPVREGKGGIMLAVTLACNEKTLLLIDLNIAERGRVNEIALRARLAADLPEVSTPDPDEAEGTACYSEELLSHLDMISKVMQEKRFGSATLALVNGIALHTGGMVAFGWLQGGYVRAQAISHLDRFEKKTENVQMLEAAMEEALDQESTLIFPEDTADHRLVLLTHERLNRAMGFSGSVAIPLLGTSHKLEAVLFFSRTHERLDKTRIAQLTLVLHLLMPWLCQLRKRDRWLGARLASWSGEKAGYLVGPEHVGRKILALLVTAILVYGFVGTWPHRIDATALLVTDSTRLMSAPFDGFLDEVAVTSGDEVALGDRLASMDVHELLLQESEVRADMIRIQAEADRGSARGDLAEVEIAKARLAQSRARLEKVLFFLSQAEIRAPFDSVVVEGERNELLGAPVSKGDKIFRIARIEGLYVQLYINERDIRYVDPEGGGELALLSRPERKIPLVLNTIVPVARVSGEEGNRFLVKAFMEHDPEQWWRPGMSGVARIDAGDRKVIWILTRRLVDTLRIKLWW
jgi:multidrug efflux pump subunit AcrA (membrane-fusion protein)